MSFHSILFRDAGGPENSPIPSEAPDCFRDLNLDQIVDVVTAGWKDYNLAPFFYTRLSDLDSVAYRQAVMQDLEDPAVRGAVDAFARRMRDMRSRLDEVSALYYRHAMNRWFVEAVARYCEAVAGLAEDLHRLDPPSPGLRAAGAYLAAYADSPAFEALATGVERIRSTLGAIRYSLLIRGSSVTVRHDAGEADYRAAVEETFERFRRGAAKDYRVPLPSPAALNHIEAEVLDRLAQLNPDAFGALEAFCAAHRDFLDPTIARFDREIQFYVAWLAHVDRLRRAGLSLCYPHLSRTSKEIDARDVFDLALATKLVDAHVPVVCNSFFLRDPERIFVVSGPNQGGKTTFARTFGQLHYLAALGCPVPGTLASLFFCDQLFCHFEREERVESLRGKLQDDLVRIRRILAQSTPDTIVILNEIFSSTTLQDAVYLGRRIVEQMSARDLLGVCVTFLDELASLNERTVSVVSTIDPQNPAVRTYRLERRPADGAAYALALAEKYRVTYAWLMERITA